jgi:hypothetical protein
LKLGCLCLIALLIALTSIQAINVVRTLTLPDNLAPHVSLLPMLEVVAGGLWTGALLWGTWGLLRRSDRRTAAWLIAAYLAYQIARTIVFARADYDRQRIPFLLVAGLGMCVIGMVIVLRVNARKDQNIIEHGDTEDTEQ